LKKYTYRYFPLNKVIRFSKKKIYFNIWIKILPYPKIVLQVIPQKAVHLFDQKICTSYSNHKLSDLHHTRHEYCYLAFPINCLNFEQKASTWSLWDYQRIRTGANLIKLLYYSEQIYILNLERENWLRLINGR
jgi:hypothetical protein